MEFKEIPSCPGYSISRDGVVINSKGFKMKSIMRCKAKSSVQFKLNKVTRTVKSLLAETWLIDGWKDQLDPGEEWKEVDGYDNYIITSKGKVWNRSRYVWLRPIRCHSYYWRICLSKNGRTINHTLHTLLGRHFLEDYREGLYILHKDETLAFPQINYIDNLFVGTPEDNTQDMIKKGRANRTNKSGYQCVQKNKNGSKYHYTFKHNGLQIVKCGFLSAKDAYEEFLVKRMELKGY